ncbi:MAG: proline--tRNA ligase [Clostridia bacterium]|nr:proline--tRNA ligase [Clostridia bacterium]
MRMSTLLAPTQREDPAEAEVASHRLMLRAGLMRRLAAGIYTLLPLGHRAVARVERIVREEMDRCGAQELRLPILQPSELWQETGRWAAYGQEMWRVCDRHGREFCLGPTHEEVVTDLIRREVKSYRQLPLTVYQIQNKYRDEVRPRFGVMRAREFVMKDAYSFDRDLAGLEATYERMREAYEVIFRRCGLRFLAVEADPGAIGGHRTHEFMALADSGEATLVLCPECGYAANVEKAETLPAPVPFDPTPRPMEAVPTPGARTIAEVSAMLGVDPRQTAKTLFYWVEGADGGREMVAVLLRGDRELNEVKLQRALGALSVRMAAADDVLTVAGAPVGSAGPVGLRSGVRLVADSEVVAVPNLVVGANRPDVHLTGVNAGRDFRPDLTADLRLAGAGDACPRCGAPLSTRAGIEVGQIFQLGTKYSEAMRAFFQDENGRERPFVMGCYGIGVTRTVAAVIEQHHDADGIVWPPSVAPFAVTVVPVQWSDPAQAAVAQQCYEAVCRAGLDAVLDDRPERAGVKFKDADLMGFPVRITVGPRALSEGRVEVRARRGGSARLVEPGGVAAAVADLLRELGEG